MIMKDFNHKNVLNLVGVVIRNNRPFVLLPYMDKGDLRKYIQDTTIVSLGRERGGWGLQKVSLTSLISRFQVKIQVKITD